MVKKNIIILSVILLLLAGSGLALGQNVAGEWEINFESFQGPQTQIFKIEQDGEKITVIMEGLQGEELGEGTIKNNKIKWKITRETKRGALTMAYTGRVDGDTMSGKMELQTRRGSAGTREWTAKKK